MASQTFAKYALPPLHSSSVNEDAPSPLSFKPSKVPVGKTDCSYDISFDSSTLSLTLQFHAKLSQSKTLILHSSTAPFCLSPAVNKNTNVDTSAVVHIKDPTALLPVTYILEVQEDSVSFQVQVFPGFSGSLEALVVDQDFAKAKLFSWPLKALMTYVLMAPSTNGDEIQLAKGNMNQKLIVSSDYDLAIIHGWMSETLVQSLPSFPKFMANDLDTGCTYKCSQSNVYISFEPSATRSILVRSSSPFPLCLLQSHILSRADTERKALDIRLENNQVIENFSGITATWLRRLTSLSNGHSGSRLIGLEKDMARELLAIQDAEGKDVFASPRFQDLLERFSKEPALENISVMADTTTTPTGHKYSQSVVLHHLFLILREVCRQKGQDATTGTARLLAHLTESYSVSDDPDQTLLKDILLS